MSKKNMELDNEDEKPFSSLKLMQRKQDADAANTELRMQAQFESALRSVEEHKGHLRQTVERMEKCKEDFKEYLKIKDLNRQLAVKKAKHDKLLTHQKQEHLHDLREETKELVQLKERLEKRVQNYEQYHHCMDRVVLASKRDAAQMISRYNSLMMARDNMQLTTQQNQEAAQKARSNLAILSKESSDAIMQLNCRLAQLQRALDEAQQNRVHWENTWACIQKTAAKKTMLFGQIRMGTLNLYRHVCKNSRFCQAFPVDPEDSSGQLEMIQMFINEWMSSLKLEASSAS
ncbi:coiled-coil domain-containing protein 42-like [Conger conger]|nr:coiled-coil domain-containing protein 42-like [Conger conger]